MPIPKFTDEQQNRLRRCGVCDEQIRRLQPVLLEIRRTIHRRAARNKVKAVLIEAAELSESLSHVLAEIALQIDAAHGEAYGHIEERYWAEHPDWVTTDDGPTSMHHLIPRLCALATAARSGVKNVPANPTRHRTANPQPIRRIDEALKYGLDYSPLKPYPKNLLPSESAGDFRQIVGICYEAAGAPADTDPLRAIRGYLSIMKIEHEAAVKVFTEALNKPRD